MSMHWSIPILIFSLSSRLLFLLLIFFSPTKQMSIFKNNAVDWLVASVGGIYYYYQCVLINFIIPRRLAVDSFSNEIFSAPEILILFPCCPCIQNSPPLLIRILHRVPIRGALFSASDMTLGRGATTTAAEPDGLTPISTAVPSTTFVPLHNRCPSPRIGRHPTTNSSPLSVPTRDTCAVTPRVAVTSVDPAWT